MSPPGAGSWDSIWPIPVSYTHLNIPIIMLSAKSTDLDKILGLGTGADDYVVKPFNPLELTARVKSQLRRYTQLNPNSASREKANNEITIKGMTINKDNHKVIVDDEEIKLTPIEDVYKRQVFHVLQEVHPS